MIWSPASVAYYVDDPTHPNIPFTLTSLNGLSGDVWPFGGRQSNFILLNLAIGFDCQSAEFVHTFSVGDAGRLRSYLQELDFADVALSDCQPIQKCDTDGHQQNDRLRVFNLGQQEAAQKNSKNGDERSARHL